MMIILTGSFFGCHKKTEEEKGKSFVEKKVDYVKGIGEGLKEKGSVAGESLSEGVTKSIKGVGQGVENALAIDIRLAQDLQKSGIKATNAQLMEKQTDTGKEINGMSVYIVCGNGLSGKLLLKAIDKRNNEIGRTNAKVSFEANDAGFVDFIFDKRVALPSAQFFILETFAGESPEKKEQKS
jgi:hypothetical protein